MNKELIFYTEVNMTNEDVVAQLKDIKITGGCLCGHGEWCEECDPFSTANKMRRKIDKLIEELQRG